MKEIKLVIYYGNGREVSCSYPYEEALRRLQAASEQPGYEGFDILEAN